MVTNAQLIILAVVAVLQAGRQTGSLCGFDSSSTNNRAKHRPVNREPSSDSFTQQACSRRPRAAAPPIIPPGVSMRLASGFFGRFALLLQRANDSCPVPSLT